MYDIVSKTMIACNFLHEIIRIMNKLIWVNMGWAIGEYGYDDLQQKIIRIRPVKILKLWFETAFNNSRSMKLFDENRHNY